MIALSLMPNFGGKMQPAVNIVNQATEESLAAMAGTSTVLWAGFQVMHRVHRVWRSWRVAKLYSNPDNFLKLIAGHTTNSIVGDHALFRVAAQSVLITTRILQSVEQKRALEDSWQRLGHALRGTYTIPERVSWKRGESSGSISPSFSARIRAKSKELRKRIHCIVKAPLHVCSQAFLLSMKIMDAIEAFSFKPEAMNELYINGSKVIEELTDNKDLLISYLEDNRVLIGKILKGAGFAGTSDDLIRRVKEAADRVDKTQGRRSYLGDLAAAFGKKMLHSVAWSLSLDFIVPESLMPPEHPPHLASYRKVVEERYPPVDRVRKVVQKVKQEKLKKTPQKSTRGEEDPLLYQWMVNVISRFR